MKVSKRIDGRTYNTQSAYCIWTRVPYADRYDWNYYEEGLFVKRTGEFFIAGEGFGAYSTEYEDGSWGAGEDVLPLDDDCARKWAKYYMPEKAYSEIFGSGKCVLETIKENAKNWKVSIHDYLNSLVLY